MLFEFGGLFRKVWRGALILGTLVIGTNTLFVAPVYAATGINQQLNFQGRLLNAQGAIAPDGFYNVEFKIYQDGTGTAAGNPGGTLKWTENWLNSASSSVRVVNGYISVQLGSINAFGNSVDWNQDTLWLSVNIGDTTNCTITTDFTTDCGGDGEMLPMKRLSAVPYALNSAQLGGLTAAGFIQNTTAVQTATNMAIDGSARADTSILTPTVDTNTAVALNIGTTNATAINLNQNVTVAAGKSLTLAGGNTASRPASPTEGMVYFDTDTKQLLTYSNGKWQADRNSSTKIVAASNSSQAAKDGADYVADGEAVLGTGTIDGDQAQINAAIAALPASGGSIYLTEGTYYLDGSIVLPSNIKLSGAGDATVISVNNTFGAALTMVANSDTTNGNTNITIRDIKFDGNDTNNNTAINAVSFTRVGTGTGATAMPGANITNTTFDDLQDDAIVFSTSNNNRITNNVFMNGASEGVQFTTGVNNIVSGNAFTNVDRAVSFSAVTYSVVSNNSIDTSGSSNGAIDINSASNYNTITGNSLKNNTDISLRIATSSNNTITGNVFADNGGSGAVSALAVQGNSNDNVISGNTFRDTAGSGYAINVDNASADRTLLEGNSLYGTGATTINDLGTGTIYGGQLNSSNNYVIQPAGTIELMRNTNVTGSLSASVSVLTPSLDRATAGTLTIGTNATNTTAITIGSAGIATTIAGNTAVTLNATTGTTITCQNASGYLSICDPSVITPSAANFIQNSTSLQATSNFYISGTGKTDTSFLTPLLDAATASTALNIGTTNASAINLNQSVTVATGKSLTMVGGNTASRPASPTEGMVYFDTDTKQLLTYSNGKWQADRTTSTKIVAASNSSQAAKDGADYVADGTGDQTEINNALTAAAGGKVYLSEGTYILGGTISVPNNTTLAGAGSGTVITIPNSVNATFTAITNTTTGGNGTGVVIQDMKLDGNKAGQSVGNYGMYGITFNGMGSSTLQGGKISNVWVNNWYGNGAFLWTYSGIYISTGQRNTISNVDVQGNTNNGLTITGTYNTVTGSDFTGNNYGIHLAANNNTVTGNSASANTANGIYLDTASQNTITGNVVTANTTTNIYLSGSNSNTISGNQTLGSSSNDGIGLSNTSTYNIVSSNIIQANSAGGVSLASSSANNTITGNKIHNNGGNNNRGIYFNNASSNTITDNTITDTANSASNNPINIDVNSANTYLSGNTFSSTATGGTIADASTTTVYVNQAKAEGGGQITNRVANDVAAFTFQKADGTNVLTVDTANSTVLVAGAVDTTTATTLSLGTTTATAITIGKAGVTTTIAGDTGVTLNATTGTTMVCRNVTGLLSTCDATYVAPTATNFIQNQAGTPGTAQTGNFNITGTGIAATLQATSVLGTTLDTASAVALEIGTTNATVINLNENVTVAAGKSLTMVGGNTASRPASPTEGMVYFDTDTKQLLTYSNGKWQADRNSSTKVVAASNASQALKDGADYVATGTSDQNIINTALTAAAGGRVYLTEGTFTTDNVISIPNDTTLAGAGRGSLIKFANINGQTRNMITNTDTTATSKGVTVRDLQLDGNWTGVNTTGTMYGIYFSSLGGGSGSTARQGPTILNTWVNNFLTSNIFLANSPNGIVSGNNVQGGGGNGIYLSSSNRMSVTGNVAQGNTGSGIVLAGEVSATVTGNTVAVNGVAGVYLNGGSNNNTVSGNNFYNNGGGTNNNAIHFPASANGDYNTITNNTINDTSGTTTNYAINFLDTTSNYNYLADNVFTSTAGTATINDAPANNTIYANQPRGEDGAQLTNRTANNTESFTIQNAGGTNVLAVDTTNSKVLVAGTLDTTTATTLNIGNTTASAVSIGNASTTTTIAGNTSVTLNATTATGMVCRNTGNGILSACDVSFLTPTTSNFIQNQAATPGTAQTGNFNITGTGIAAILQGSTSIATPLLDAVSGVLSLGTGANSTSVTIGKAAAGTLIASSTTTVGTSGSATNILGAAQTTNNTAGNSMTIAGSAGLGNGNGGNVTIQGGNGGTTGAYGGNLTLAGGTGTTSNGAVILATSTFQTATSDANCFPSGSERTTNSDCTIAQSSVNNNASVIAGFTNDGRTATLPDPSILTAGRVVYVTASNGTKDFTLTVNGGGQGNQIAMRKNTTATMIWNGADWTAAGASSSTTMQAAYDNTLQSAGGAELVVSKTSATNGLTIRDSSVNSVNGALLTVQSSSAANLFSVNSNVTEYTSNSGAETYSGTTTAFPASTWAALTGSTVTRNVTTTNAATGQGSAQVATSTTAGSGVKNVLNTTLTPGQHYNVSFSAKLSSGTFTDMAIYYSIDGSTDSVTCTTGQAIKTSVWTKVNCTFTAPSSGLTSSNSINIRQANSGTTHTFYVDNISVTIAADYNYATDAGADDTVNFSTNWSTAGTATVTQNLSDGNDASSSAQASTSTANSGVRNKLSINPLASTLYRISVYAKLSSGAALNDFRIRYTPNGGTSYVDCVDYNKQAVTSTWTQITCYMTTDATTASNPYVYFLQTTASGTRVILVDTFSMTLASSTTPNVQIGSGSNGGPTTLFTLDKGASAPIAANNDALLGSMYYDTTLGKLQCYEADGWGACGSSPDNIVTISPEYTNAVMHGTGIGTMISDICSDALNINDGSSSQPIICGTNETYNFYKWTSPQATAQTYSIYVTYQLPATFKEFASGQTSVMGRTDSANSTVQYQIYRSNSASGMTTCGGGVTVSTGIQTSWQPGQASGASDPSTCGFAAGDSIVFKISTTASSNANAYVGNLGFTFSNR